MIKRDLVFIEHILNAISNIQLSIKGLSKEDFIETQDLKDANIRRIEIIGEAVKNISEDIKNKYPEIEWKKIIGTRDRLIHAYFRIDLDIMWEIIKNDLPILKNKIIKIKNNLENSKDKDEF